MRTFSLDIASHDGHLACVEDGAVRSIRTVGRVTDAELIPLAETVLKEAGWKTTDIGRIACNVGPGGFTSVRLGVTFANAMADRLDVPLGGFHGSELARARVGREDVLWAHSTKAHALFVRGGQWDEPTLVAVDELLAERPAMTAGDLLDAHREALESRGWSVCEKHPVSDSLGRLLGELEYDRKPLLPWYGRGI